MHASPNEQAESAQRWSGGDEQIDKEDKTKKKYITVTNIEYLERTYSNSNLIQYRIKIFYIEQNTFVTNILKFWKIQHRINFLNGIYVIL